MKNVKYKQMKLTLQVKLRTKNSEFIIFSSFKIHIQLALMLRAKSEIILFEYCTGSFAQFAKCHFCANEATNLR